MFSARLRRFRGGSDDEDDIAAPELVNMPAHEKSATPVAMYQSLL